MCPAHLSLRDGNWTAMLNAYTHGSWSSVVGWSCVHELSSVDVHELAACCPGSLAEVQSCMWQHHISQYSPALLMAPRRSLASCVARVFCPGPRQWLRVTCQGNQSGGVNKAFASSTKFLRSILVAECWSSLAAAASRAGWPAGNPPGETGPWLQPTHIKHITLNSCKLKHVTAATWNSSGQKACDGVVPYFDSQSQTFTHSCC